MLFKEFCEKALSNDLIGFVEGDIMKDVPAEATPAYKFLLEDADQDILTRKIDRFTYAAIDGYNRNVLIVKLDFFGRNAEFNENYLEVVKTSTTSSRCDTGKEI